MERPSFRRLGWVALWLLLPLAIAGWFRLRLESDILATLPDSLPEAHALRTLRDGFEGGSDLLIAVSAEDPVVAEETTRDIAHALRADPAKVKEVRGGQSLEESFGAGPALIGWSLLQADPDQVGTLVESLEGDGARKKSEAAAAKLATALDGESIQRLAYDPLGLLGALDLRDASDMEGLFPGLQSEDGTLQVLTATPAETVGNYKAAAAWLQEIRTIVDHAASGRPVVIRYTGEPAFQAEIGGGIAKDMSNTVGLTEVLIALLFWVMFRMLKPLLWIQLLLMVSLGLALGLGGLIVGKLSVMSLGFAAIVLGIITDYAVLIIQEARDHAGLDAKGLRRLAAPGITAGACTTATVFLSLCLTGLPGLVELGVLVALGVLVGFGVMLAFAPVFAARMPAPRESANLSRRPVKPLLGIAGTAVLLLGIGGVFTFRGLPVFATGADALRPSKSEALDVWQSMQQKLGKDHEASIPMILNGSPDEIRGRAKALDDALRQARADGVVTRAAVPLLIVPDPAAQQRNRPALLRLLELQPALEKAVLDAGFTEDALGLFRGVADGLRQDLPKAWPLAAADSAARPILGRMLALKEHGAVLASAAVPGTPDAPDRAKLAELQHRLEKTPGAAVAGWETLGGALSARMQRDLFRQLGPILAILIFTLWLTFRSTRDVVISLCMLLAGIGALAATMVLCRIPWNLASLAAIPLLLGTGIDYGIHLLLSLKRHDNDIALVRATTGRAVFFSGMTTVIGFASLFFAGNRGIASLGMACCLGTLWIMAIVLGLMPHWRLWFHGRKRAGHAGALGA